MVQYLASASLPTLTNELCRSPGKMSHSLAFGLSNLLGRSALSEVLRVCPFGILTVLNDGYPVGMAPPSGVMKLLVAPESRTAFCPNMFFKELVGSLNSFLILNSSFNFSIIGTGMCGTHWSIGSLTKFAWGSNSFQVERAGFQFGGKGRSQLETMLESCPPQNRPPSETWQDSSAACSLLSTAVCCCSLGFAV